MRLSQGGAGANRSEEDMGYVSDQDGKSKTASAADQESYPEQNEVENGVNPEDPHLTHNEISRRAYELWESHRGQHRSAEQDWLQAEAELSSERARRRRAVVPNGSVQP